MHKTLLLVLLAASCFGQNAARIPVSYPRVVAKVALTGRTAPIPTTTLFTPAKDGLYRISSYGVVTVDISTFGQWDVLLNWVDDSGPELCGGSNGAQPCALMYMWTDSPLHYGAGIGGYSYAAPNTTTVVQAKAGVPVTYSVVADANGSPTGSTYELFITVEQLMQF
jgi:hypothetical protein